MGKGTALVNTRAQALDPDQHLNLAEALEPIKDDLLAICPQSAKDEDKKPLHKRREHDLYNRHNVMAVLRVIAAGMPQSTAAAVIGCAPETLSRWKAVHPDFALAVDRANALNQMLLVGRVLKGMEKNPRLALDLLDRRHPKYFAPTKRVEQTGSVEHRVGPSQMLSQLHETRQKLDALDSGSSTDGSETKAIDVEAE